jgi:RimJ/RimL family protein N-acetyltransferase
VYGPPDEREVTYWIDRSAWGRGIASQALGLLLEAVPERPLLGGAATDNVASLTVLRRHGFQEIGRDRAFAAGVGHEVEEVRMRLEG